MKSNQFVIQLGFRLQDFESYIQIGTYIFLYPKMYEYAKRRSSTVTAVQKHKDSIISYQDIAKFRETTKILCNSAKIYQRQRYEKRLKYDNRFTLSNGTPNFFYETSCRIVILLQDVEVFKEKCRKADLQPATKDFRKAQYSNLGISHMLQFPIQKFFL